jgi:DNA-binding NarL/FixJ family response regulator
MTLTVAIVEDNDRVRQGLAALLNGTPGFECVGSWADAETALAELPAQNPAVVLMDINLPGLDGVECARRLRSAPPQVQSQMQILMLTVHEDEDRIFEALKAGAHGYLTKQTPSAEILEAITQVHQGGGPMSPNIARKVIQFFHPVQLSPKAPPPEQGSATLSPREQEILERLSQGFLYKEIAAALAIGVETVRTHVRNIYEKLHVHTRTEALLKVYGRPEPRQTR